MTNLLSIFIGDSVQWHKMCLRETINEGIGERTARYSSVLRRAEVIFTVSFVPV